MLRPAWDLITNKIKSKDTDLYILEDILEDMCIIDPKTITYMILTVKTWFFHVTLLPHILPLLVADSAFCLNKKYGNSDKRIRSLLTFVNVKQVICYIINVTVKTVILFVE